jgi:hypothetical protein
MNRDYSDALDQLAQGGWSVERLSQREPLLSEVAKRYPRLPADFLEFIEECGLVASPRDTAWLVTTRVVAGQADVAYAWNEWEVQSLEAAEGDIDWKEAITRFWDRHFPVLMSVKSGYAYFALDLETFQVVQGEEPEYEETTPIAGSLKELLQMLASGDPKLSRWV